MAPDPTETADVLDRAADLLERDGWRRGRMGPTTARVSAPRCALGALMAAGRVRDSRARLAFRAELGSDITVWNDVLASDKRQVVRALRRTARKLRGASR